MSVGMKLGEVLVHAGLIDEFQLQSALGHQRQWGGRLGKILIDNGFIEEGKLVKALARQLRLPTVEPDQKEIHPRV